MINLIDNTSNKEPGVVLAKDIPDGQVFRGRIGANYPRLFIKVVGVNEHPHIYALDVEIPFAGEWRWFGRDVSIDGYVPVNAELRILDR